MRGLLAASAWIGMALQCTQVDSDRSGGLKKRFRKNSSI
jgi:hypothetical protein